MKKVLLALVCGVMFLLTSCGGGPKSDAKKAFKLFVEYTECMKNNDDCSDLEEKIAKFEEKIANYSEEEQKIYEEEFMKLMTEDDK